MFHRSLRWLRGFMDRNLAVIIIVAAIVGPAYVATSFERQRLTVLCESYRIELGDYRRDVAIADTLGIPITFPRPVFPKECR